MALSIATLMQAWPRNALTDPTRYLAIFRSKTHFLSMPSPAESPQKRAVPTNARSLTDRLRRSSKMSPNRQRTCANNGLATNRPTNPAKSASHLM